MNLPFMAQFEEPLRERKVSTSMAMASVSQVTGAWTAPKQGNPHPDVDADIDP